MSTPETRPFKLCVEIGEPFETGGACTACLFDSMVAVLLIVNGRPGFREFCGRKCCREAS